MSTILQVSCATLVYIFISCIPALAAPVQSPILLKNITGTGTSWFGSPIIHSLGAGNKKLVGTFYDIFVWNDQYIELAVAHHGLEQHQDRIYPPAVVADLDRDGTYEIVVGSTGGSVAAYEWKNDTLVMKSGWPRSCCDGEQCPEARGIAGGDLDNDGNIEIVVTTTQTIPMPRFLFSTLMVLFISRQIIHSLHGLVITNAMERAAMVMIMARETMAMAVTD